MDFKPGFYKHWEGDVYYAMRLAIHTETGEELVMYWGENKEGYWACPLPMFMDGRFTRSAPESLSEEIQE